VGLLVGCWCIDQARFPILSGLVGLLVGWFSLVGCSDPFSGFPGCWWAGGGWFRSFRAGGLVGDIRRSPAPPRECREYPEKLKSKNLQKLVDKLL